MIKAGLEFMVKSQSHMAQRYANIRRNTAQEIFAELSDLQRGCDGDYYTISKAKLDELKNKFGIR
jgi:hypothetical protein